MDSRSLAKPLTCTALEPKISAQQKVSIYISNLASAVPQNKKEVIFRISK